MPPAGALAGDGSARQRAEAMRWLAFVNSDLHPAFSPLFAPGKFIADESQHERCARPRANACANCRRRRAAGHARLAGRLPQLRRPVLLHHPALGRRAGVDLSGWPASPPSSSAWRPMPACRPH
jgi:glutathione S-transferase